MVLKARTFMRNVIDPQTGDYAASPLLIAPYYIADPRVGAVTASLAPGTYPVHQELKLHHPDPTAIIWYTITETDDPDLAPAPEMFIPPSLIQLRSIDLGASPTPAVMIKARAYVTRADGMIAPGPVTTLVYHLAPTS